jgi:hypothetical protein
LTRYAVQVQWFEGNWTYVMDTFGKHRLLYDTREQAEEMRRIWVKPGHEDAVRIVEVVD